jgi:hypothetical protein
MVSWFISIILTLPVLYYSDVVIVGDGDQDEDNMMCKITWLNESREQCIKIVNDRCLKFFFESLMGFYTQMTITNKKFQF